ncbi:MAG: DNA polymerase [Gracilibacter sp. BRH_c7a]|nr:MAG: DNA polymerase [Gracilibacter sp. BRH_c7a]
MSLTIEGKEVRISNAEKVLWPEQGIRKIDYIGKLLELAPYLLPHAKNRLLTSIRYPDGVQGKSFYQKNLPQSAPSWIPTSTWHENNYIILNDTAVLAWLGNQAVLEFHTTFNLYTKESYPVNLVFDLDPSEGQTFEDTVEVALLIHHELQNLNISSYVKTSGASGLQIYLPVGGRYDYETARKINEFFAVFFSQKYPGKITIERSVPKRGKKLYFDYLQMWQGKTIISPYSPRATQSATVATPLDWYELEQGIKPEDFTILNISERLKTKNDLFQPLLKENTGQDLGFLIELIDKSKVHL